MKKHFNIFMLAVIVLLGLSLTACNNDDLNTDQYGSDVRVQAFGPCPVLRGGTLFFYGSHLDQISEIDLPGADPITSIDVLEQGEHSKISIQVPAEKCDTGIVVLKTQKGGEIRTVTPVTYREDVKMDKFYVGTEGNLSGKPGDELTIKGDYLNLMHGVIFADNDTVKEESFVSRDRYTIVVRIPETARTGIIKVTDLAEEPSVLESEEALDVKATTVTSLTPAQPKTGQTVTIKGSMMQLVEAVSLNGAIVMADEFTKSSSDEIAFTLPAEATDGEVTLYLKSGVEVPAGSIETVVPTNLKATPSPVKNGATLTISGNDLDLVTAVSFPTTDGTVDAAISSKSESELKVIVPETAQGGNVTLTLGNDKQVTVACAVKAATISAVSPQSLMAGERLVIRGTDLDLVASITFPTSQTVDVKDMRVTSQAIVVTVPSGAAGTGFVMIQKNGVKVENNTLAIRPSTDPTMTNAPTGNPGKSVTIEGSNYNRVEAIYIGSTKVTKITERTDTKMTFEIPSSVEAGEYDLTLTTTDGGSYNVGKMTVVPNEIDLSGNLVRTDDGTTKVNLPISLTWGDDGRFYVMKTGSADVSKYTWTAGKSKFRMYVDPTIGGKAQINDYSWGNTFYLEDYDGQPYVEFTLTASQIAYFTGEADGWGRLFTIQGDQLKVTKIVAIP